MDAPRYLQVIWAHKWLAVLGVIVAVACGFLAGYRIVDGEIQSRATHLYSASTTTLLSDASKALYRAEIPGQRLDEGQTTPQAVDLTQNAGLYAYLISGDTVRTLVEDSVGRFKDDDDLTAVRRTTQPRGSEEFPGRQSLPIVEIVGQSDTAGRAESISRAADQAFQKYVQDQQKLGRIPDSQRVDLSTIATKDAVALPGSNPAIPMVVTFLGVLLAFAALILALHGARDGVRRRRARSAHRRRDAAEAAPGALATPDFTPDDFLFPPSADSRPEPDELPSRRRSVIGRRRQDSTSSS